MQTVSQTKIEYKLYRTGINLRPQNSFSLARVHHKERKRKKKKTKNRNKFHNL